MVVASSPHPAKKSSSHLSEVQIRWRQAVVDRIAEGETAHQIANKMAKGDLRKRKTIYNKIRRLARNDKDFQQRLAATAQGEAFLALVPATRAAGQRASRGRMDAVKGIWAVTGYHNDKVSHEHAGEIQINVSIPRPPPVEDKLGIQEPIVDADVVED
jgi:hypothetical protein